MIVLVLKDKIYSMNHFPIKEIDKSEIENKKIIEVVIRNDEGIELYLE